MKKQKLSMLKAWLLVLCMVVSLVPATAFAAEPDLDTMLAGILAKYEEYLDANEELKETYPSVGEVETLVENLTTGEDPLIPSEVTEQLVNEAYNAVVTEDKPLNEALAGVTDIVKTEILENPEFPAEKKLDIIQSVGETVGDSVLGGAGGSGDSAVDVSEVLAYLDVVKAIVSQLKAEGLMTDESANALINIVYNQLMSGAAVDAEALIVEIYGVVFEELTIEQKVRVVVVVYEVLDSQGYVQAAIDTAVEMVKTYGPQAVVALKDYAVAEGWVTYDEIADFEDLVAQVVADFEADPEAAAEKYALALYALGLEKGYYTEDEVNAFVADVKAIIADACDIYEDVKDFVETATPQDWENLVKTYGAEALNKLYAYAVAEGYFNPEDPAVQELLADLAALKDLIENTTEEDVVNAVNGYIADLQAKYDAMIFNATHTEFVKGADTNYVALGGSTVTGNFGVSRNDAIYADLVAEELGVVAVNKGLDTLTAATALDYVMGNAAAIAAADLVTYQLDAASFVTALGETPDWTKYVDAEVLAQAQAIADEVAAVLALDWSAADVQGMVDAIVADVVDEIAGYDVKAAVLAAIEELTVAVVAELDAFNAVEAAAAVKAAVADLVAAQPDVVKNADLVKMVVATINDTLAGVADADTAAIKAAVDAVVAEKTPVVEQAVVDAINYVDGVIDACVEKVEAALAMAEGVKQDVLADLSVAMDPEVMGLIEKVAYIAVTYAVDNIAAIEAIQTINPEATVAVVGMYNPLRGLTVTVDGETIDLGEIFEYVIDATNVYYTVYAVLDGGVVFVDVADAETEGLNMNIDVNNFGGLNIQTLVDDMYANAAGHEYIYEQIMDALSVLKGDVDLDGDVDTDDMTVLVRHVARIEALTEARAMVNGDVDSDGNLDTDDITKLTRFVARIDESL